MISKQLTCSIVVVGITGFDSWTDAMAGGPDQTISSLQTKSNAALTNMKLSVSLLSGRHVFYLLLITLFETKTVNCFWKQKLVHYAKMQSL